MALSLMLLPTSGDCRYEDALFEERVLSIIDAHDLSKPENPLFLFYSPHIVHEPLQVPQRWIDKFAFIEDDNRRRYHAMVFSAFCLSPLSLLSTCCLPLLSVVYLFLYCLLSTSVAAVYLCRCCLPLSLLSTCCLPLSLLSACLLCAPLLSASVAILRQTAGGGYIV